MTCDGYSEQSSASGIRGEEGRGGGEGGREGGNEWRRGGGGGGGRAGERAGRRRGGDKKGNGMRGGGGRAGQQGAGRGGGGRPGGRGGGGGAGGRGQGTCTTARTNCMRVWIVYACRYACMSYSACKCQDARCVMELSFLVVLLSVRLLPCARRQFEVRFCIVRIAEPRHVPDPEWSLQSCEAVAVGCRTTFSGLFLI